MQSNNRSWKALALLALALGASAVRWDAEQDERSQSRLAGCAVLTDADDCSIPSSSWLAHR